MERHKALPLYIRVAETIRGRIFNRQYQQGALIPAARELAEEFDVSNITIRKAIDLLTQEGLLAPKQGLGTLVAKSRNGTVEIQITGNFRDWLDSATGRKLSLQAEVIELTLVRPPGRIRELLSLDTDDKVSRMKRLRKYKGQSISYFVNFFPQDLCHKIKKTEVEKRSFIEFIQERCDVCLRRIEQQVEATIADMELADILGVDFGTPLFFVENVYYSDQTTPVMVTHMYYRGDRYVYKATIPLEPD